MDKEKQFAKLKRNKSIIIKATVNDIISVFMNMEFDARKGYEKAIEFMDRLRAIQNDKI